MRIFGGMRKIIYSKSGEGFEEQLNSCILQLEQFMDKHQLYPGCFVKHNIFVNINDYPTYKQQKKILEKQIKQQFPLPLVVNIIAQPPVQSDVALESIYINNRKWEGVYRTNKWGSCQYLKNDEHELVLGTVQVNDASDTKTNSEKAFLAVNHLLEQCNMQLKNIIRQWNYVEHLLEYDEKTQRYQAFNDVRTKFYGDIYEQMGYPAATGIGMRTGGIIIEFLAAKNPEKITNVIDNPRQRAAHEYSDNVLVGKAIYNEQNCTTPKFERARSLEINDFKMIMVSGTAAITGERTIAENDINEQVHITLENIKTLISKENLVTSGIKTDKDAELMNLRVYVKNPDHFESVKDMIKEKIGDIPMLLCKADICRNDLLVEIEGEAML